MIPVPDGVPLDDFLAWTARLGIDYSLDDDRATKWGKSNGGWINHYEDVIIVRSWEVSRWKDHQWRQKECEYIRVIDGLQCEIKELKNRPTEEDAADHALI